MADSYASARGRDDGRGRVEAAIKRTSPTHRPKIRLQLRRAKARLPIELPSTVMVQVVLSKVVTHSLHLGRQFALLDGLGRPIPRCQDVHRQLWPRALLALLLGVSPHVLLGHAHVREHALELLGELVSTLPLELRNHGLLRV